MPAGKIAIGVYPPAKPGHGLLVGSELRFSVAYPNEPAPAPLRPTNFRHKHV